MENVEWLNLSTALLDKSKNSFISAIESYNKVSHHNKLETFVVLMVNAWELFLKSKAIQSKKTIKAIYYKASSSRTYSISTILKKLYENPNTPIRKNIEIMITLRDQAVHLLVPEIGPDVSRIFQASIILFMNEYQNLTGFPALEVDNVGMISLVIPGNTNTALIKNKYGEKIYEIISDYQKKILNIEKDLGQLSTSFSVPMEYSVFLQKKATNADFFVTVGSEGNAKLNVTKVIEDPKKLYLYKFKDVVSKIKNSGFDKFSSHTLTCIIKENKIKENSDYSFELIEGTFKYSEKFINYLKNTLQSNSEVSDFQQ